MCFFFWFLVKGQVNKHGDPSGFSRFYYRLGKRWTLMQRIGCPKFWACDLQSWPTAVGKILFAFGHLVLSDEKSYYKTTVWDFFVFLINSKTFQNPPMALAVPSQSTFENIHVSRLGLPGFFSRPGASVGPGTSFSLPSWVPLAKRSVGQQNGGQKPFKHLSRKPWRPWPWKITQNYWKKQKLSCFLTWHHEGGSPFKILATLSSL